MPSRYCINANAQALARYAALCQDVGLVPIVEPEVLMDGSHDIDRCAEVTEATLRALFAELYEAHVALEGALLKPNMVIAGKKSASQASTEEVAEKTVRTLLRSVPAALPGIVFLSGGQGPAQATENLNAMNAMGAYPWELSFSYGRALQEPVLNAWRGSPTNVVAAQRAYYHRAACNSAARLGTYTSMMETMEPALPA
jgi:fructose-bisphosphate aldolase class I